MAEAMALGAAYARVRSAGYVYSVGRGTLSHRLTLPHVQAMIDADRRAIDRHRSRLTPDAQAAWAAGLSGILFSGGKLSDYMLDGEGTR